MGRSTARGRVFTKKGTWYGEVIDSTGKVVWRDNSGWGARQTIIADTIESVHAVRVIENMGHRLEHSWTELVDEAPEF